MIKGLPFLVVGKLKVLRMSRMGRWQDTATGAGYRLEAEPVFRSPLGLRMSDTVGGDWTDLTDDEVASILAPLSPRRVAEDSWEW